MKKILISVAALCAMFAAPTLAEAAVRGFATANVNMRSGPSTGYPAVTVIPAGESVTINGCLSNVNWCDVSFYGGRGWVSGTYVQASYRSNRVYVGPQYYRPLGIPTITFDVDTYWGRYYRDRDFYRDRNRWRRYTWDPYDRPSPPPPPRWDRDRDRDPPRWDRDPRRWDRDPPRWDRDDRRPPRWDRDRDNWDRDRDDRRPPRVDRDEPRRPPPRVDRDEPRRPPPRIDRDEPRRPPPPRVDQDDDRSLTPRFNRGEDRRPPPPPEPSGDSLRCAPGVEGCAPRQ
ncbi:SH3 domain-containing protein [Neorhizobium alkalisoli]|uniref:SH3 domain-containing protein n=1 Tax=Neorhizobium alkalisoli TaxID=528178 RepID=UPI00387E53C3